MHGFALDLFNENKRSKDRKVVCNTNNVATGIDMAKAINILHKGGNKISCSGRNKGVVAEVTKCSITKVTKVLLYVVNYDLKAETIYCNITSPI